MKDFDPQKEGILCSICAVLISEPEVVAKDLRIRLEEDGEFVNGLKIIKARGCPVICQTCKALNREIEPDPPEQITDINAIVSKPCEKCGNLFDYVKRTDRGGRERQFCDRCLMVKRNEKSKGYREKHKSMQNGMLDFLNKKGN